MGEKMNYHIFFMTKYNKEPENDLLKILISVQGNLNDQEETNDDRRSYIKEEMEKQENPYVYLENLRLTEDETNYIAELLKPNMAVKRLYLNNNVIGYEGFLTILKSLESNTTLEALYLNDNQIGKSYEESHHHVTMDHPTFTNKVLRRMELANNEISSEFTEILTKYLECFK